ncbi:MAG: HAD family hydrolase [Kiritimatiellaeota bacterium]|nr:HAD family hydrolase [Kiritimatiellota bacterium]
MWTKADLVGGRTRHDALVGVDSDGCVFPTMEIKQRQCFHTEIIRRWRLEKIEHPLRACAEFINLHSRWRGTNRFPALLRTFDLLRTRPDVPAAGVPLPDTAALRAYCASGLPLSNATLQQEAERTGDPELQCVLAWSLAVNANIERTVKDVPPFPWVRESLEKICRRADLIVVSQTPEEALRREWQAQRLDHFPAVIAGQEAGTKAEQLGRAAGGRYAAGRVLMIGDAPGDLEAARLQHALFYPINPGQEEASWKHFLEDACDRFLAGAYAGAGEAALIAAFETLLPATPPWGT